MKKILIAGGTGFVGKQLIPFLVEKGYSIHVLTRNIFANKRNFGQKKSEQ